MMIGSVINAALGGGDITGGITRARDSEDGADRKDDNDHETSNDHDDNSSKKSDNDHE